MITRSLARFATAVNPLSIQKGAILKFDDRYVQVTATKSNPVGTQFEFIEVLDKTAKGKFRVKSYETVDLVNEEFTVEVERIDNDNDCLITSTNTYERINVPLTLLGDEQTPPPGAKITITTDHGTFVKLKVKAAASTPKWQSN